jgi:hypothetical protein
MPFVPWRSTSSLPAVLQPITVAFARMPSGSARTAVAICCSAVGSGFCAAATPAVPAISTPAAITLSRFIIVSCPG